MTEPHAPSPVDAFLDRFTLWAEQREDVRGALLIGSRARGDAPADEWSDVDIVLLVRNPGRYLEAADWVDELGEVWLTFREPTPVGETAERRVMFAGAMDVDFVPVGGTQLHEALEDEGVRYALSRGFRVLVDKDARLLGLIVPASDLESGGTPGSAEFLDVVNDFWYHAAWTVKKLRRGELWVAKAACDGHMKQLLLRMIEWPARAVRGPDYDTWHRGRFLERWADPAVVEELRSTFARYDEQEIPPALTATDEPLAGAISRDGDAASPPVSAGPRAQRERLDPRPALRTGVRQPGRAARRAPLAPSRTRRGSAPPPRPRPASGTRPTRLASPPRSGSGCARRGPRR